MNSQWLIKVKSKVRLMSRLFKMRSRQRVKSSLRIMKSHHLLIRNVIESKL